MARRNVVIVLLMAVSTSCGPKIMHGPRHDARLITREQIQRTGATDALEALKRAGSFLNISDSRNVVRASQRGRGSFLLSPQILLVVDGVMMVDLNPLRTIPAQSVDSMRVLTALEATSVFGTEGSNGALVVTTRIPTQ